MEFIKLCHVVFNPAFCDELRKSNGKNRVGARVGLSILTAFAGIPVLWIPQITFMSLYFINRNTKNISSVNLSGTAKGVHNQRAQVFDGGKVRSSSVISDEDLKKIIFNGMNFTDDNPDSYLTKIKSGSNAFLNDILTNQRYVQMDDRTYEYVRYLNNGDIEKLDLKGFGDHQRSKIRVCQAFLRYLILTNQIYGMQYGRDGFFVLIQDDLQFRNDPQFLRQESPRLAKQDLLNSI